MSPFRLLVVDDEPLPRKRLARQLEEAGHRVVAQLGNGYQLLEHLETQEPVDAVFLDIQMPGANGLEVMAASSRLPPVVFVTAFAEYAVQAFELAALDYLLKPVSTARLTATLQRLEERRIRPLTGEEWRAALNPPPRFPIKAAGGEIFMELDKISHFTVETGRVFAHHGTNRYETRWYSLTEVEEAFPGAGLIRIQRNILLRPEAARGIRPIVGSRIKVLVAPGVELAVSRAMTPGTRERIHERLHPSAE